MYIYIYKNLTTFSKVGNCKPWTHLHMWIPLKRRCGAPPLNSYQNLCWGPLKCPLWATPTKLHMCSL